MEDYDMKIIGGSIPCEICSSNTVSGIVYKISDGYFICEDCYDKLNEATEMMVERDNGLKQFEEGEE